MAILEGRVLSVGTANLAEQTTYDHPFGEVYLNVSDAGTFDDQGGEVILDGNRIAYLSVNIEESHLLLAAPLPVSVPDGSLVEVFPPVPEKYATVELPGEGDAVPVSVPYALSELLPDGMRDEDRQETVLVDWLAGQLSILDVLGQPLPPSMIEPERLTIGMTGNMIQDAALTTGLHSPAVSPPFQIMGPDLVHTDSNFIRCTSTDGSHPFLVLTPRFHVAPDQVVSCTVELRCDLAAETANGAAGINIAWYRSMDETGLGYDTDAHLWATWDMYVDQWNPLQGTFAPPEGYAYGQVELFTDDQTAGTLDFIRPTAQVVSNRVQSANYVEGQSGFRLDEDVTQVQNLSVVEEIGATTVSTETLMLDGIDLSVTLDALPASCLAYDIVTTGFNSGNLNTVDTEYALLEMTATGLKGDQLYRIVADGHYQGVANQQIDLRLRRTVDGSAPTTASPLMRTKRIVLPGAAGTSSSLGFEIEKPYSPGVDVDVLRILLTGQRRNGAQNESSFLYNDLIDRATFMYVNPMGSLALAEAGGALTQKSVEAGGTLGGDSVQVTKRTWAATWARTYQGAPFDWAIDVNPDEPAQGWHPEFGNRRSLFGFNYTDIQAKLAGATIRGVWLTYKVRVQAGGSAGAPVYLKSGPWAASPPIAYDPAQVNAVGSWAANKSGVLYRRALPVAVGNGFKAGTIACLGFGPTASNALAQGAVMYGVGASGPKLEIEYVK